MLAEPDRLTTFAALVLGAATPSEVAASTGLPARQIVAALRRLEAGGLVTSVDGRIVAEANAFKEAVREHAPPPAVEEDLDPDRAKAAVLRVFVRDGRILRMPAARGKRRIILEHIVASFEPGIRYPERAVDAILRAWYDDHAALRRYLIDEGLMSRENAIYWRTGGYVTL
ncbi:hypothetical protein Pflav_080500 [Phytohabitans flavus]|uniref:DUF2087 domain-containing protein n=1 Tax=Phytohabitans flavus TaxID=1076124 RepID=A0A6F8Y6E9_9ACTN|nr:hypothetical protein Pflav_080500 [Phytohabitans flavus]